MLHRKTTPGKMFGLYIFYSLLNNNIWLIGEKLTEARDNGYHLFKYLRKNHSETNAFYVIKKGSADFHKVNRIGPVIYANSFRHYLYYAAAKYNIGSQPYGAAPAPTSLNFWIRKICRKDKKTIFLQHGITHNDQPILYYNKTHYDLFVSGAKREYDYILQHFGYPEKNLKLVGFCRFDNLHQQEHQKIILVVPTFRKNLAAKDREHPATEKEIDKFKASTFYKAFSSLLGNEKLRSILHQNGYKLIYYMHYSFQSYTDCFQEFSNEDILIVERTHYDVQQLMLDSAIMITDFSSVFFDFAYMLKPVIYFQPDEKEFRQQHYQKGYFDCSTDGFGPVFTSAEKTVDYLECLLKDKGKMEKRYEDKVCGFFTIRDTNNCERTFEAICKL